MPLLIDATPLCTAATSVIWPNNANPWVIINWTAHNVSIYCIIVVQFVSLCFFKHSFSSSVFSFSPIPMHCCVAPSGHTLDLQRLPCPGAMHLDQLTKRLPCPPMRCSFYPRGRREAPSRGFRLKPWSRWNRPHTLLRTSDSLK